MPHLQEAALRLQWSWEARPIIGLFLPLKPTEHLPQCGVLQLKPRPP